MTPRTPAGSKAAPRPTFSRSSASAAAPRWCTGTTWWWDKPDRTGKEKRRVSSRREKVRQPGADASPHRVTRQAGNREPGREFYAPAQFSALVILVPKKEDPGAEEPGSLAGWVRGWGLGGTPPGGI